MALPKEPRQKMINLMYLVLTALLALNVSSEILLAFRTVNNSLVKTNSVLESSTGTVMKSLQAKASQPETREKALIWLPVAQDVQKESADMYNFINSVKDSLIAGSKSDPKDTTFKEDDLNASSRILVDGPLGKQLLAKLKTYEANVLKNPDVKTQFQGQLPIDLTIPKTQSQGNSSWEQAYFHMTPTIAAITILSKFQNDVKTTENRLVSYIHSKVGEVDVRFDQFAPLLTANSNYLMPGDEIELSAGVAAFSSANKPSISINGAGGQLGPDGFVRSKFKVSGSGPHTVSASFTYVDQDNKTRTETRQVSYVVGTPGALAVSTDKTRVFYVGLDNPVTLRGAGGAEGLRLSSVSGPISISGSNGNFIVKASAPGSSVVKATDGKSTADITIPVKRVPSPVAKVGGSGGGTMGAGVFRAQKGVAADLLDFVFEGVRFEVSQFTIVFTGKGFEEEGLVAVDVSGAYFNADAKRAMQRCQAGTSVQISDIKVVGPGGSRSLDQTIAFILQ